jgi:hypothetical protein
MSTIRQITLPLALVAPPEITSNSLDWARASWQQQPADLAVELEQAAHSVLTAITQTWHRVSIVLPRHIRFDDKLSSLPLLRIRAGKLLPVGKRVSWCVEVVRDLQRLQVHELPPVRHLALLLGYRVSQQLVDDLDAKLMSQTLPLYFDVHGHLLTSTDAAYSGVQLLADYVQTLHTAEKLFTGWQADPHFDDLYSSLTLRLMGQGRALAQYDVQVLIDELFARWHKGEIARGLTLTFYYLDEGSFQLKHYRLEVIPPSRIPFQPELVVGACRIEQQRVRKYSEVSQNTRWQLVALLDLIIQAFENVSTRAAEN